jgi:hypothetical protein
MDLLDHNSLGSTLDAVSEALFFDTPIPEPQRLAVSEWIARRQGLPGSYANTFAPTEQDTLGIRLFTGESIRTRAGMSHILGEEACRVLALLRVNRRPVNDSFKRAVSGLAARIQEAETCGSPCGFYCCGACTAAYWRNLAAGLLPRAEARLVLGLAGLRNLRCGNGRWRRFPFFYTSLALTEIGPGLAKAEMQYTAGYWARNLTRLARAEGRASKRRAAVGQRLLELCES